MGCGASKVEPQKNERKFSVHAERTTDKRSNGHTNGVNIGAVLNPIESSAGKDANLKPQITEINGNVLVDSTDTSDNRRQSSSNGVLTSHASSPLLSSQSRSVAFDIPLGQNGSAPIAVRPPRRLQKIESAPVLTKEALEQKQAAADLKRQKELEKKVKVMSKRRSELLLAREVDKSQQQKAELDEKLAASEKKREKTHASIKEKQRRREEKAKRVRMRAKKMKEDDVADLNVDPDETYNADEEDESWDIGSPQSFAGSTGKVDKDDNEQIGFKESGTGSQTNEGETAEKQQQEMKEVHDFFDL
ncbi:uncharacterized protein LOC141889229 [Acropora palmata]|uniref:uncharacterized protein LOC141889229 n=1 Tax=Acropora palmata TaxID=6131 RepID=UPI003DA15217